MSTPAPSHRLLFVQLNTDYAADFFALNEDPEVLRYTGDPPFANIDAAHAFLTDYEQVYAQSGMGRWGVLRKSDRVFVGWCGLKRHQNGEVDLGFRLLKRFWGNGLATEAAEACLKYGFETLKLPYIIGRSMRENTASIRVLEKVGMQFWKESVEDLHDACVYRIDKSTYLSHDTTSPKPI
jgi:ribosomal-protein-alanine N-acetyltransferase